jgi:hypothetical protein
MSTRLIAAIGLVLAFGASVHAQVFRATLNGAQESPPVTTDGTGSGMATFNPTTNTLDVNVSFSGLTGNTTDSHIHCCFTPTNRNAGVAVGFTPHGFPIGVTSGTFNAAIDLANPANYTSAFLNANGGTAASARSALLAGMTNGIAYFNIHTSAHAPGEIRGDTALVPEPAALLLVAIAAVQLLAFRRSRGRRFD